MSKKSAVLSGQKGDAVHVPVTKRRAIKLGTPEQTKALDIYHNDDVIGATPEGQAVSRLAKNTNSTKVPA